MSYMPDLVPRDDLGGKPSLGTKRSTRLRNLCPVLFKFFRSIE